MADFNRGIMKFDGADSPIAIVISTSIVIGTVIALVWWALHYAYSL